MTTYRIRIKRKENKQEISILVRYWLWIVDKDLTRVRIPSANNRLSTDREIEEREYVEDLNIVILLIDHLENKLLMLYNLELSLHYYLIWAFQAWDTFLYELQLVDNEHSDL